MQGSDCSLSSDPVIVPGPTTLPHRLLDTWPLIDLSALSIGHTTYLGPRILMGAASYYELAATPWEIRVIGTGLVSPSGPHIYIAATTQRATTVLFLFVLSHPLSA
jgi:hypothetical protein